MAKIHIYQSLRGEMRLKKIGHEIWKVSWPHKNENDTYYEKQFCGPNAYNKARMFFTDKKTDDIYARSYQAQRRAIAKRLAAQACGK